MFWTEQSDLYRFEQTAVTLIDHKSRFKIENKLVETANDHLNWSFTP